MGLVSFAFVFAMLLALPYYAESCGPAKFDPANILETDKKGKVLANFTAEPGVAWEVKLKPFQGVPEDSSLYQVLLDSIEINQTTGNGYHYVKLVKEVDLERPFELSNVKLSHIKYTFMCTPINGPSTSFEFFLIVHPVNEFAPQFVGAPFKFEIAENMPVGDVLIKLRDNATDLDVVTSTDNDVHEFGMETNDAISYFGMDDKQNGIITVSRSPDFEQFDSAADAVLTYNITVWDQARWNTTSTLTVKILDADDLPPQYYYPGCTHEPCYVVYRCDVPYNFTGPVKNMRPHNILAKDGDTLGYHVTYRVESGPPHPPIGKMITVNETTGVLTVLEPLSVYEELEIVIKVRATETSALKLHKDTSVFIKVNYPNDYLTTTPKAGASTDTHARKSIMTVVIVLSVFVVLAFLAIGCLFVYFKKRADKPIYPADDFEEEHDDEADAEVTELKQGGGSNTDSGQWSMNGGGPSPGHHAGSEAPNQTRLPKKAKQAKAKAVGKNQVMEIGEVAAPVPSGRPKRAKSAAARRPASSASRLGSARSSSGESRGRLSMADINPQDVSHYEAMSEMYNNGMMMMPDENGMYPDGSMAMMPMEGTEGYDGYMPQFSSYDVVEEGDETTEGEVTGGGGGGGARRPRRQAPKSAPAGKQRTAGGADAQKRPRTSRKERREQKEAQLKEERFDGTKVYPMEADPAFFTDGNKQKVKQSTRKRNQSLVLDPRQWITVDNDYYDM